MKHVMKPTMQRERGFGAIAAIMILVILAALAAAIVSLGTTQQTTSALDVMSARAWQAARAGNEYGLFRALNTTSADWDCDVADTTTLDLTADTGFYVTVTCKSWPYNEGETETGSQLVRVFEIRAIACPVNPCTETTDGSSAFYVERARSVIATE